LDLLGMLAFLPSVISSFLPNIRGGTRAPPLDPPLARAQIIWFFDCRQTKQVAALLWNWKAVNVVFNN